MQHVKNLDTPQKCYLRIVTDHFLKHEERKLGMKNSILKKEPTGLLD